MKKGFTLVEIIIYASLVSIIMGFAVLMLYQILSSQEQLKNKADLNEETNFVLQKINWAISGANIINQPTANSTSSVLSVNKVNFGQNPLVFDLNNGLVRLSQGGGSAVELNSQNVPFNQLVFEHLAASGSAPAAVKTTITARAKTYSKSLESVFYLRQ